ncbi:MAG UNVERIFIED_CONTAM: hypothetical protein LVR18_15425 [Planctomycetaceae bacterium]
MISKNIELLTSDYSDARRATEQTRNLGTELQRAINQNEDILQFASEALDSAGRQLIEQSMGLGSQDNFHIQRIMQEILDIQSRLTESRQKYGLRHPKIRELQSELAVKEGYLRQFPAEQRARMEQLSRQVLAPRLVQYVGQQLQKYEQNERSILERLNAEQKKAQTISQILTQLSDLDRRIEQLYAATNCAADAVGRHWFEQGHLSEHEDSEPSDGTAAAGLSATHTCCAAVADAGNNGRSGCDLGSGHYGRSLPYSGGTQTSPRYSGSVHDSADD